jgi:hypothetical protein
MTTSKLSQLDKLDALIAAAQRARIAAEHNLLFADRRGLALLNAIFDLVEVEGVYDLARDVEREVRCPDETERSELYAKLIGRAA